MLRPFAVRLPRRRMTACNQEELKRMDREPSTQANILSREVQKCQFKIS